MASRSGPRSRARPGMREVAARAGVAMSSVSRVLSDHPDVSDQMREQVLAAVRDLGYRPDILAQSMRSLRTLSVGFTVSDIANPVLAETIKGAERRLREAGYSLLLTDSENRAELDVEQIKLLDQRRVDGFLLSLADESHPETATLLQTIDVPIVLVDRDRPEGIDARRVAFDHESGMRAAARHLLELGHRDVLFLVGGPRRPARQRQGGIQQEFAAADVGAHCEVVEVDFTVEAARQATESALARSKRPSAIIAGGNMLMHGSLRALRAAGVRVSDEMSVIGCDDTTVAEFHDPPITVVRRDTRAIGAAAADMLLAALEGRDAPDEKVLPTEFITRGSVADLRGR